MRDLDAVFEALKHSPFRMKFKLDARDARYLRSQDAATIHQHAGDFVSKRLAPAEPKNDGKQTPMRGHPVFVAQHATATCCRSCLAKWHGIAKGKPLDAAEIEHVIAAIKTWLANQP